MEISQSLINMNMFHEEPPTLTFSLAKTNKERANKRSEGHEGNI